MSFEEFMRHLTQEEQQKLVKYLPYTDTTKLPERSVFMLLTSNFNFYYKIISLCHSFLSTVDLFCRNIKHPSRF